MDIKQRVGKEKYQTYFIESDKHLVDYCHKMILRYIKKELEQ